MTGRGPAALAAAAALVLAAAAVIALAPRGGRPAAADPADPADPAPAADAARRELAAWDEARPVLHHWCARCHTLTGARARPDSLDRFDMTRYPIRGLHAGDIGPAIRKVLGADGDAPEMPKDRPGAVRGDDLATILAWTEAWAAAHPPRRPPARHHRHRPRRRRPR